MAAETLPTSHQMFRRAVKPIPLERMDGSPASADNSLWVCARTATGVQPAIELVAGGMGKQGKEAPKYRVFPISIWVGKENRYTCGI